MQNNKNLGFNIRNASHADLPQLLELEKEWAEYERATEEQLKFRLERFSEGYFIAETQNEIVGSIIACPTHYHPHQLNEFKNWEARVSHCYSKENLLSHTNALYLVSGTIKSSFQNSYLFTEGLNAVIYLAQNMNKSYIIAGAVLPGYAKFLQRHPTYSASDYVFKKIRGHFIDPLIERYRRIGFHVPDEKHILDNYFPHSKSLNYAAMVVKHVD